MQSLQRVPASELGLWGVVGLIALAIIVFAVRAEARHFRRCGRGSAWLKLRLATLPILAIAIAAVIATISASGVGGMEGLAVGYLALFTVGPLVYFGVHWLLGRAVGLRSGQASWIAFSGLVMVGIIPAMAGVALPPLHSAVRALHGADPAATDTTPMAASPYTVAAAHRLTLPDGEEVRAVDYRAPDGVTLVRVDMQTSDYLAKDLLNTETTTLCRHGQDLHLLWPADRPLPVLHVFWKDAAGRRLRSDWTPQVPAGAAEPFVVSWEGAMLRLPVPVSRSALSLAWARPGSSPLVVPLLEISAGNDCAPQKIVLPERAELGRPSGLRLRTDHTLPKGPTWADFKSPAVAPPQGAGTGG